MLRLAWSLDFRIQGLRIRSGGDGTGCYRAESSTPCVTCLQVKGQGLGAFWCFHDIKQASADAYAVGSADSRKARTDSLLHVARLTEDKKSHSESSLGSGQEPRMLRVYSV